MVFLFLVKVYRVQLRVQKFLMFFFKEFVDRAVSGSIEQHLYCCPYYGVLFGVAEYGYGFSVYLDLDIYQAFRKLSSPPVPSDNPSFYALELFWSCGNI